MTAEDRATVKIKVLQEKIKYLEEQNSRLNRLLEGYHERTLQFKNNFRDLVISSLEN